MTAVLGSSFPMYPLRRFVNELTDGPFGSSLTSSHYSDSGARVVRLGNIGAANFRDEDVAYIPMDYFEVLRQHEVKPGDLIIAGLGDGNHPVGRACVAPDNLGLAIVKADCFRARLDEGRLTHRFAAWAMSSSVVSGQVQTLTRGSTRARINLEVARDIRLPTPSVMEQQRIADFLDSETGRIDRIYRLREHMLRKLIERDRAFRDTVVNTLSDVSGELPLRRFMIRIDQGASPQCESEPRRSPNEWGVLKLSAVRAGRFNPMENKRLPSYIIPRKDLEIEVGDLLVSRANTPSLVGDAALVREASPRLLLPDLVYRLRLDSRVSSEYIEQVILSGRVRSIVEATARGSSQSMVKLRSEDIRAWPIPIATRYEQDRVAQKISQQLRESEFVQEAVLAQLGVLAERRQALITAAVTGQFDVSTASGRGVTE